MADLDLTNFQGFLDYEGLTYVKEKNDALTDEKIAVETQRATNAETALDNAKVDKTTVATSTTLGLVKSGTDITVDSAGNVSVNNNSHTHTVSNISDLTATAAELNIMDGVTATTAEINKLDGLTATTTELNYVDGVTSNIQTQLNAKAKIASPTFTGTPKAPTATEGTNTTQIATTAFVQTAVSSLVDSAPTTLNTLNELAAALGDDPNFATTVSTQIGEIESDVADIIDGTTTVAKATSATSATTASKLGSSTVGSATQPIYLDDGTATKCTYTLGKSVPSDALFTDTVYTHPSYTARTGVPTANQTPAFGGTFSVNQIVSNSTGHVTAATSRTITIPNTLSNGTDTAGLIKTTSTVTSNSGYTACPVISGVPYYQATSYTHPASGVTAGTYRSVTVDANGHVTAGSNPTTTVAQGGTGKTTLTSGYALVGNGTSAVSLRAITATPTSGSTSLFTAGGAYTQLAKKVNTSAVTTSLASTSTTAPLAASAGKDLQDQITALNSDLELVMSNNIRINQADLFFEIYCNVLYLYGTVNAELTIGWNAIINPIPLTFTLAGTFDTQFVVIDNTSTSSSNQFLQARIERGTNILSVYSWENKQANLLINTSASLIV